MPRIRSIKPEFFTDADLADLPPLHRLFWAGLWGHQDREGRCLDKPRELKAKILPYDEADADLILWDLHEAGFVIRYEVDGRRYIGTPEFPKHQRPHKDEKPSELPGWEGAIRRHRTGTALPPPLPVVAKVEARPAEQITSAKSPEAVDGGGGGLLSLEAVAAAPKKPAQQPSRFKTLQALMVAEFFDVRQEVYLWHGAKDSDSLKALMAIATDEEIRARWRLSLELVGWKQCNTIAQLRSKWNDITAPEAKARSFG